jgi:hypothetical protein
MWKASAMHVALTSVEGSASEDNWADVCGGVDLGLMSKMERFGCCAMMATRRREFLAVAARVGLRFEGAVMESEGVALLRVASIALVSSLLEER